MNLIAKVLQEIDFAIPTEVLQVAFVSKNNSRGFAVGSMENEILRKVIHKRVVPDAGMAKGEHAFIDISKVLPKYVDDYRATYEIPARLLQGRKLVSVMSISYSPFAGGGASVAGASYGGVSPMYSNDVMTAAQQMIEASSSIPNVSTSRVEIVGENTIMVEDAQRYNTAYHLSCYLIDTNWMNKMDPRYFDAFSEMAVYAVKSYIYKHLRVKIDKGHIEAGAEIGEISDVVREFADAEANYKTYLRGPWAKIAKILNRDRYYRGMAAQVYVAT